jgi:AraC family L-rhamnose operon transcriptional activator RhaR/AraC family L-rhamnose operon regulatory protein RhaS
MDARMVSRQFQNLLEYQKEQKYIQGDISLHWHNIYEFEIVLSGSGEMICNGKTWQLCRGMVCLLSPADFHEYRDCRDVSLLNLQFSENGIGYEILSSFLQQKTAVIYADEKSLQAFVTLCELLDGSACGPYRGSCDRKLLECAILLFLNQCTAKTQPPEAVSPIQKAILYVDSHFRENPPMAEVAALFYLNETYFCRLFRKTTGFSYKTYLRQRKLNASLSLLRYTRLPVAQIAGRCGYDTVSHFNREFKSAYGIAPTTFRKQTAV